MRSRPLVLVGVLMYLLVQGIQSLPSLWRMHCIMSGRGVVQWGQGKACAPEPDGEHDTSVDAACCIFTHVDRACFEQLTHASALLVTEGVDPKPSPVGRVTVVRSLPRVPFAARWDHGPPPEGAQHFVVRCGGLLI